MVKELLQVTPLFMGVSLVFSSVMCALDNQAIQTESIALFLAGCFVILWHFEFNK